MSAESGFPDFSELLARGSEVEVREDSTKRIPVSQAEKELIDKGAAMREEGMRRAQAQALEGQMTPITFYEDVLSKTEFKEVAVANAVASLYQKDTLWEKEDFYVESDPTESVKMQGSSLGMQETTAQGLGLWKAQQNMLSSGPFLEGVQRNVIQRFQPAVVTKEAFSCAELATIMKERVYLKRFRGEIHLFNGAVYRKLSSEELNAKVYTVLKNEIEGMGSPYLLKGVSSFLKADESLDDVPVQNPMLLCLRNGVLDLRQWTLFPHSPEYFFTSCLNVDFSDSAPVDAPVFEQFLQRVTGGNPVLRQRMLETLGLLLTTDMNAKVFVFIQGVADSGKSVFGQVITDFFNPEDISCVDIFRMGDRFTTHTLVDKRLNISMDLPSTRLHESAVGVVKMLTGNDGVAAEKKFGDTIVYNCGCKLVYGSNYPIQLGRVDQAFENRMLLIPFQYPIPKEQQNKCLFAQMRLEKAAILRLALEAYLGLVRNNYIFTGGNLGAVQVAHPSAVVPLENIMERFISSCCVQTMQEVFTTTEELYNCFRRFYLREVGSTFNGDSAAFSRLFHRLAPWAAGGKKRVEQGNLNGYYGVTVNPVLRSE